MLTLIDIIEEELDELLELEEDLAEDDLTLEDFCEWTEQLSEEQVTEDLLDEKESQANYITRMKKLGRKARRINKLSSTKRKKKRAQLKRKTAAKIQKSALRKAQGDVIPKSVMKASGTGGMIKRKRWKEMKKARVDRKVKVKKREVKRGEPARMKAARRAMANRK